jgi:hypothetical protein
MPRGRPAKYAKSKGGRYARHTPRFPARAVVAMVVAQKRTRRGSNRPRHLLNRSPFRGANQYPFTRSTSEYLQSWTAPDDHSLFSMNKDNTYYVMKMKMQLSALPDYEEFQNLFTQYNVKKTSQCEKTSRKTCTIFFEQLFMTLSGLLLGNTSPHTKPCFSDVYIQAPTRWQTSDGTTLGRPLVDHVRRNH